MLYELGPKMHHWWSEAGENPEAFPSLATRLLADFQYKFSLSELEASIADWTVAGAALPEQVNLHNTFGQPPLTIFNNGKFVVDLYLWVNFDTSLHSHGFRGAFRVLHGCSLHEEFSAETLRSFGKDVRLADLGRPRTSVLKAGDVRTIEPGLCHRVIHLENPTVTLCVKTINEPDLHQWNYFANGLAIQKRNIPPGLIKSIYYFGYLFDRQTAAAADYLDRLLGSAEASLQMNLYEEVGSGGLDLSEDAAGAVLDDIAARFTGSEWFNLYEEAMQAAQMEIDFSHSDSATERLLGHAANAGYTKDEAGALLAEVSPLR